MVRIQPDRVLVRFLRLLGLASLPQQDPDVVVGVGVVRTQFETR